MRYCGASGTCTSGRNDRTFFGRAVIGDTIDTTQYISALKGLSEWRRFAKSYRDAFVRELNERKIPSANFVNYTIAVDNCLSQVTKALRAGLERKGATRLKK